MVKELSNKLSLLIQNKKSFFQIFKFFLNSYQSVHIQDDLERRQTIKLNLLYTMYEYLTNEYFEIFPYNLNNIKNKYRQIFYEISFDFEHDVKNCLLLLEKQNEVIELIYKFQEMYENHYKNSINNLKIILGDDVVYNVFEYI